MEFRKIVMTALYARQQERHRLKGRHSQNGLKKSQGMNATSMSTDRGIDKENVVHTYNGISQPLKRMK